MSHRAVHLCMHFHCDPIFTCPQAVHVAESIELAAQYVSVGREEEAFRCILSEMDYLHGYFAIYVEEREEFLRLLREGRIETSGSYSEPNENSVGGEALVRNLVYGQWYLVDYLGARGDVYMPFDVFGHVRQLPQLLKKAGFVGAVWTKGSPLHRNDTTWWVAPDGSRILNRVASYGGADWGTGDQLQGVLAAGDGSQGRPQEHEPQTVIMFRGSDFVSPPRWVVGRADLLADHHVKVSVPSAFFEEVDEEVRQASLRLPLTAREMSLYHAGTALSRSELKIGTRLAEERTIEAETWATLATLFGVSYPEAQLDFAWRQMLFSQHHDSITGTSNDQSYLDLMSHLREALAVSAEARERSVAEIAARVRTDGRPGEPVVLFNSLSIPQTGTVEASVPGFEGGKSARVTDDTGESILSEAIPTDTGGVVRFLASDVLGVGFRTYWLTPGEETGATPPVIESDDEPITLETPFARVTFDPWRGGGIVSLVERTSGHEVRAGTSDHPLNDLVGLKEGAGPEPAWEFNTTGAKTFASTYRASLRAERTATGWTVTITHPFPDTERVIRTVTLSDASARIDCTIEFVGYSGSRLIGGDRHARPWGGAENTGVDEPEDRDLFGVLFPVGLQGVAPVWSDRFGYRVIRKSRGWLDFRTHQSRIYSGCAMYSAEKWIAASPNVSVLVIADEEAGRQGFPLGMVRVVFPDDAVIRDAAERLITAVCAHGVTATPFLDTDEQDSDPLQTDHIIALGGPDRNAWVATNGWQVAGRRFVRDVKLWKDSDRLIPALVLQGSDDAVIAAEADRVIAELSNGKIPVPKELVESSSVGPLDAAGLAVLNRGTIAASYEPDGSLFLALQHAAGWCDWATPQYLGFPFVPERKTTVHHYALLPFAGSWAQAGVPEEAERYNRPLVVRREGRHGGTLPSSCRLVAVEGHGVLLSALKPEGQPSARFVERVQDGADGTVMRLWNRTPEERTVRVSWWTGVENGERTDLAERPLEPIPTDEGGANVLIGPNAVETFRLVPRRPAEGCAPTGNVPAPAGRVECRWWLQNTGAAPMGDLPFGVALRGDILPGETGVATLSVADNTTDRWLSGEVQLVVPAGWTVNPTVVPVSLRPMQGTTHRVEVAIPAGSPGRLAAEMVVGDQTYADTLVCGEVRDPIVRVSSRDGAVSARIENPSNHILHLTATLITPLETWPEAECYCRYPTPFRRQDLTLRPGERHDVTIPVHPAMLRSSWAFLKVAGAGRCSYYRVPTMLEGTLDVPAAMPVTVSVPRADIALVAEAKRIGGVTLRASVTHNVPPDGCPSSPIPTAAKYWTVEPVRGIGTLTATRLRFGITPSETKTLPRTSAAQMALWSNGRWKPQATKFDAGSWTLEVAVETDFLRSRTRWAVVGPTCVEWQTRVGGRFFEAEPVAADINSDGAPEIVVGTAWNQICALDLAGTVLWRRQFGGWVWPSPAFTVADVTGSGRLEVIAAPSDRTLALLDGDGRIIWRRDDLPFAVKRPPTVADCDGDGASEILVSINDDGLWIFAPDGTLIRRIALEPMRLSSPVVTTFPGDDAPTTLVNAGGKRLVMLDAAGGVRREIVFGEGGAVGRLVGEPVVTDVIRPGETSILLPGHDGCVRLIAPGGSEQWCTDVGSPVLRRPLVLPATGAHAPLVVVAGSKQTLCALDTDGRVVWSVSLNSTIQSQPSLGDVDGDGEDEIIVGAARARQTYVFRWDGTEVGAIPYEAIWSNSAAVLPSSGGGAALVTGTTEECVVSAVPFRRSD